MVFIPRVEVLRPSTLGYVIATPSELLLLVGHNSSLMMRPQGLYMISLLSLVCAPSTMYAYTIVDDAPPRVIHNWFVVDDVRPYNHVWLSHRGRCAPLATLKELRFPSPGLRAKLATLGKRPTNLATLTELRLAVGVTCNVYAHIP